MSSNLMKVERSKQAMISKDTAMTGDLTGAIETLLPALEHFLQFVEPESTAGEQAAWSSKLDEPLPQTGAGAQAVLTLLRDVVIPNGLRLGMPGFSGWVATAPTTIPAMANFAAIIAIAGIVVGAVATHPENPGIPSRNPLGITTSRNRVSTAWAPAPV